MSDEVVSICYRKLKWRRCQPSRLRMVGVAIFQNVCARDRPAFME
jgi:hypothetical protein